MKETNLHLVISQLFATYMFNRYGSFIWYVRKIFRKNNIFMRVRIRG